MKNQKGSKYVALTYPDFRLFWFSLLISNIGSQMQMVAINWHIYVLTNSAIALGMIGLLRFIPIIFSALIAGSFADTHNRKKIMLGSQVVFAILSLVLAVSSIFGTVSPLLIYSITVISAVAFSFDLPARQAFIPNLVDKKHLTNAISLNTIMFQASLITGPTIAGFLIGLFGVSIIYEINAVSYLAIIVALFLMKTSGDVIGEKSTVSFHSFKEGMRFLKSKTIIWSTMLLDFFSTFFSAAYALLPIFAKDILHVGPQGLGLLYAAPAFGAFLAGFVIAHIGELKKQGKILLISIGIYGLATVMFGLSKIYIVSLLALALVGFGDGISMIIRNTIRQLSTPDHIRGRMTAINMIFFMGGPQLGEFESGILAHFVGAPISVVSGGFGAIIVVIIVAIMVPTLRRYNKHES